MNTRKSFVAALMLATQLHYAAGVLPAQDFATTSWTPVARSPYTANWQTVGTTNGYDRTTYRWSADPRNAYGAAPTTVPAAYYAQPANAYAANYAGVSPISYASPSPYVADPRLAATHWQTTGYGYGGPAAPAPYYGGAPASCPNVGAVGIQQPYGYGSQMPRGYYKGDGLFGKDTVYANGQPIRNLFRFLAP